MSLIPGQGHFGADAIPGDARWRRVRAAPHAAHAHAHAHAPLTAPRAKSQGESVSLKAARDTMVPLEMAQHAQMVYTAR